MSRYKGNAEREFTHGYFNCNTKTVITFEDSLDKAIRFIQPYYTALGPRASCFDHVRSISGNLNKIA